jgi:ArsR family metal-binding transcriptional regulator
VSDDAANRTRELLFAGDLAVVGYYDLPGTERPLPDGKCRDDSRCEDASFVENIWLAYMAQCFADTSKIRLTAHHKEDTGPLFPYLNSVMKGAQYNPGEPTLCFKRGVRMITLFSHKIAIAKADDLCDGWMCLKEIKDLLDDVNERRKSITPNFEMSNPPTALEIYRHLPRTNCGQCGKPACMAFAALLFNGEAGHGDCPVLLEDHYSEMRSQLLELLGET